jgi:hypothetical protein
MNPTNGPTQPQALPPGGWYQDPHNAQMMRYWDGAAWTAQTRPAQMAQSQAMPAEDNFAGVTLLKSARALLRQDRSMMLMPLIAGLCGLLPVAVLIVLQITLNPVGGFQYVMFVGALFVFTLISTFFSVALAHGAMSRMNGDDPTIGSCIQAAKGNLPSILKWAAFASAVGLALRIIESKLGGIAALLTRFIGDAAFAAASFFVVPMLTHAETGPVEALKASSSLLGRHWRRAVRVNLRFGLYTLGIVGGAMALSIAGAFLVGVAAPLGIAVIAAGALALVYAVLYLNALSTYTKCALYRYAYGMTTPGFSAQALQGAVKQR